MKIDKLEPPRRYTAGSVEISDCARIRLDPDEQVTFLTGAEAEYDVARKSWGFYATPSMNHRLRGFGWRVALVKNPSARFFVMIVEEGKEDDFNEYLAHDGQEIVCWLSSDETLAAIETAMNREPK